MKKLLILASALVLLAILAVPAVALADTTGGAYVIGTISAPTISFTAPGAVTWDVLKIGVNDKQTASYGSVTVTDYGSANNVNWQVVAQDNSDSAWGYMKINGNGAPLTNPLYISKDNTNWCYAWISGGPFLTYTGTNNNNTLDFYAYQTVVAGDGVGYYYTTITFTATITSYN